MSSCVTPKRFLGCDVGKASITVFDSQTQRSYSLANKPAALRAFAESLDAHCLVICEATGGYEAALLAALVTAGLAAHRADARKVKAFIRSFGTLGKSDKIDAKGLSRYGAERHAALARWQPREEDRLNLQTLVLTRHDLVKSHTAFQNRLAAPQSAAVHRHLKRVVATLAAEIAKIETEIEELLHSSSSLKLATKVLTSIVGIGAATAPALLALMPELGTLKRRQITALAGLAPHPNQSGEREGYRRTRGGRHSVKDALFMAAQSAARYHPELSALYERLVARGKKKIIAIAAVRRKLLVIANAKLREATALEALRP
jgi:transposase